MDCSCGAYSICLSVKLSHKKHRCRTSPSRLFYSPVKGWTNACKLRAGDILVLINGEYVVVEKIQHEILESPVKVYNFQVEDGPYLLCLRCGRAGA